METMSRTNRDEAILAAIAAINPTELDEGDELRIEILENSGLIAVSWKPSIMSGAWDLSDYRGWGLHRTKLDSGESIAYTEEGVAYLHRYQLELDAEAARE